MSQFNVSGVNVFKAAAVVSAVGFGWFFFVSPESANAAAKADGFLVATFAALAAYFYTQCKALEENDQRECIWRKIDAQEESIDRRISDVWREVDDLRDQCNKCNSTSPCGLKKSR